MNAKHRGERERRGKPPCPGLPETSCSSTFTGLHYFVEECPEGQWHCKVCKAPRPAPISYIRDADGTIRFLDVYLDWLLPEEV